MIDGQKYVSIIDSKKKIENINTAKFDDNLPQASGLLNFFFGCCKSFLRSKISFNI